MAVSNHKGFFAERKQGFRHGLADPYTFVHDPRKNTRIVFRNNNSSLIFKFFLVYGITYLFNLLALSRFNAAGFNMSAAGAIMLLPSAILSYFLNKKLVFRETRAESDLKDEK